ncbi:hypothetical protein FOC1_g10009631 [Fusarium oxysporum f. sp. cubense race 1]|uniref:Uncharacterized protein n=1 Tax=Fusarium oxysporum f. sp. cubense (strain race 1) TaxID=1229664 RepID=N4UNJ4_FUSC1|nr:hypothetical protein FOC1_g10009631 [Fusarium oxysporum f. sp. cubense race 1]
MASSNPFRKSAAITVDSASFPNSTSSAASRFPALDQIETASTPPPPTSFQQAGSSTIDSKSNITKKVRVLSPPPLSPDSPEWAFAAPSIAQQTANQRNEDDPFDATSTDDSDREMVAAAARGYAPNGGQGIGNPFSKTLRSVDSPVAEQKLEHERKEEGHALKAANTTRRSLDVNAFKRLLMTGNTEDISPPENALQEASLISEQASDTPEDDIDQENVSDSSASAQLSSKNSKKPPPPPSSRHGKSIKLDLVGQASREPLATLSSDMNKPLPPAPVRRSMEEGGESPFDREAAGKVPEAEGDVGLASPEPSGGSRKAVPAPPPRRGHARGESKVYASGLGLTQQQFVHNEENLSRSSSMRSRPEHNRRDSHAAAPPPPPPRSHHTSRQSTQIPSGVTSSLTDLSQSSSSPAPSLDVDMSTTSTPSQLRQSSTFELTPLRDTQSGTHQPVTTTKSWAPPPPPARNISVRRPASIRSVDSSSRRISFEAKPHNQMAPPPPPRRQRGSSRGSVDGPRRTSLDGVGKAGSSQVAEEEPDNVAATVGSGPTSPQSANEPGKSVDILADLDALQREVDALRGKLG